MQSSGNHEMNHQPQVIVQTDGHAFANPPQFANLAALDIAERRYRGTKHEGASHPDSLQSSAHDSRSERRQVGTDVGEFGHIRSTYDRLSVYLNGPAGAQDIGRFAGGGKWGGFGR